jgi:glyoxylase-like metal-dependent hydrolase (beta-lactamase superfamily II)
LSDRSRVLWNTAHLQAELFGFHLPPMTEEPSPYPGDGVLRKAGIDIEVMETPGHSPDHVALVVRSMGVVFAGDVIFRRSIGRTDIYLADQRELERSIRERIYSLPDSYRILPGHGVETTVGEERRENPFVRG